MAFRWAATANPGEALEIERAIKAGVLPAGKPLLNH